MESNGLIAKTGFILLVVIVFLILMNLGGDLKSREANPRMNGASLR